MSKPGKSMSKQLLQEQYNNFLNNSNILNDDWYKSLKKYSEAMNLIVKNAKSDKYNSYESLNSDFKRITDSKEDFLQRYLFESNNGLSKIGQQLISLDRRDELWSELKDDVKPLIEILVQKDKETAYNLTHSLVNENKWAVFYRFVRAIFPNDFTSVDASGHFNELYKKLTDEFNIGLASKNQIEVSKVIMNLIEGGDIYTKQIFFWEFKSGNEFKSSEIYIVGWYYVYGFLVHLLEKLYITHNSYSGTILYNLLKDCDEYVEENEWFANIVNDESESTSLTPLQIFAAFNDVDSQEDGRTNQIILLFKLLLNVVYDSNNPDEEPDDIYYHICMIIENNTRIDYTSWVGYHVNNLLINRVTEEQNKIWDIFSKFQKNDLDKGEISSYLSKTVELYNIDLQSMSIFLYWINSNSFYPLISNLSHILNANTKTKDILNSIDRYCEFVCNNNIDVYRDLVSYVDSDFQEIYSGNANKISNIRSSIRKIFSINPDIDRRGDFKILSIKLGQEDNVIYNSLNKGELYSFYDSYDYIVKNGEEYLIYNEGKDCELFDINTGLKVSACAIVGKNGSGKSTLFELIFGIIYNISFKLEYISDSLEIDEDKFELSFINDLNVSLYIKTSNLYKIEVLDSKIKVYKFSNHNEKNKTHYKRNKSEITFKSEFLKQFCYSIVVNYSAYSLNSNQIGSWISALFHKNDSYQTPIVIEPYRNGGNIDINKQNAFVKARMLSNLLEPENLPANSVRNFYNSFRRLTEDGKNYTDVKQISLGLLGSEKLNIKINSKYVETTFKEIVNYFNELISEERFNYKMFDDCERVKNYIIYKLQSITKTYPVYAKYTLTNIQSIKKYIPKILSDRSHITYKIRQAVFYVLLKLEDIYKLEIGLSISNIEGEIEKLKFSNLSLNLNTIDLLPPPIFKVDILVGNETDEYSIDKLSSGEKQLLYSVNSILYQLRNIDSVALNNNDELTKYNYVNIFLDEVELYFHPEMQRKYLSYLLAGIKRAKLNNILALNICFVTHSPYMLSDIPESNILFLDNNGEAKTDKPKTFGANIHDLLINGFFMESSIGDFALNKIHEVIKFTKCDESSISDNDECQRIINLIGEPIIKNKLQQMLDDKRGPKNTLEYHKMMVEKLEKEQ